MSDRVLRVTTETVAPKVEASAASAEPQVWWARFGTFVFDDHTPDELTELRPKLLEQLSKDSRVTRAGAVPGRTFWDATEIFYPVQIENEDELLSGADHIHGSQFGNPITFSVHVPLKNQPEINGQLASIEDYEVAWDGISAVVAWRDKAEKVPTAAAGQVVVDILRAALQAIDSELMVQACSPGCERMFGHTDMRVALTGAADHKVDWVADGATRLVEVEIASEYVTSNNIAAALHSEISIPAETFALMKNKARRILNLEHSARRKTNVLLHLEYAALQRADVGFWKGIAFAVQDAALAIAGRGRGRPAKRLIAELWLHMAAIESLQLAFRDSERNYRDSVDGPAMRTLFDGDLKSDEAGVAEVDVSFARAAIESKSARLDTRGVVVATLVAAVVGSGVGAAIGGVLT